MTLTDLSDEISPFPDAGSLLYGHRNLTELDFQSPLPPQKLRPIRNNGKSTEYSGVLLENGCFPGNLQCGQQEPVSALPHAGVQSEVLPLQKLRPVRGSGKDSMEWFDASVNVSDGDLSEIFGGAGNRWPQAESLALLGIRSEMDAQFKDAKAKGPLWEMVSRKLEQMGYHRDSKKCKEKFENLYKYYRRTKERLLRMGPGSCKTYKFFTELEALDNQNNENPNADTRLLENTRIQTPDPVETPIQLVVLETSSTDFFSEYISSSDDEGDEEEEEVDYGVESNEGIVEHANRKRKRQMREKLELCLENLVEKVMKKQEEMHKQLMELIEKWENDRIIRQEAWKQKEMEWEKRDKAMRAQEMSRSLAIISFIEKVLGQQIYIPQPSESLYLEVDQEESHNQMKNESTGNKGWPKSEVHALIIHRTAMEHKFRSVGPKGPIWEEISLAMSSNGYNRSAKKCKEKWENINKYFKRTMGAGKEQLENANKCPYFHELDILHKNRLRDPKNTPQQSEQ